MSTFAAIAVVTATLRQMLLEVVQADVPGANVTTLRPSDAGPGLPTIGVNVFLFALHTNAAQRNRDLPVRRASGTTLQTPLVPLDLDYLITFYGEANGAAHLLAGSVMRALYARPFLDDASIAAAEATSGLHSGLAAQPDRVRLTPVALPLEEMSKLWSVFFQTSYALSVVFRAGPVLIEAGEAPAAAPPVLSRQITTSPLQRPEVTAVLDAADPAAPILPGATVAVLGRALAGAFTVVLLGGQEVTPASVSDTRLVVVLPAPLPAGSVGLAVRQDIPVGSPPMPRPGVESDGVVFVLHPLVTQPGGVTLGPVTGTGAAPRSAAVTVQVTPPAGAGQSASLELLDAAGTVAYAVAETPRTAASATLRFAVAGVAAGGYAVRVRVDGAESPVKPDATPGSPTLGQTVPRLVLP